MHLNDIEVAIKAVELGEKVLPEIESVIAQIQTADGGKRPTLKQIWPHIEKALDTAINDTPVGEIHV